jgi:hypothetical protein
MRVRIPGPPEELVIRVKEMFSYAWDRGWNRLAGSKLSKVHEHTCRGELLTLILDEVNTTEGKYRVGHCTKCECFYYLGPV